MDRLSLLRTPPPLGTGSFFPCLSHPQDPLFCLLVCSVPLEKNVRLILLWLFLHFFSIFFSRVCLKKRALHCFPTHTAWCSFLSVPSSMPRRLSSGGIFFCLSLILVSLRSSLLFGAKAGGLSCLYVCVSFLEVHPGCLFIFSYWSGRRCLRLGCFPRVSALFLLFLETKKCVVYASHIKMSCRP